MLEIHRLPLLKPVTHDPTSWMKTVECDKLDGKSCRLSYHTTFVVWNWMELDGTRSESYDLIISLLEKDYHPCALF